MATLTIVCVDDQRDVLAALRKDLTFFESAFEIIDCESAAEAAEVMDEIDANGDYVALLICDHVMPEQTGVDFLVEVQADLRFTHTRKLLLTGLATHADTIQAINQAGVDYYIEKPWEPERLVAVVKTLVTAFILRVGISYQTLLPYLDQQALYKALRTQTA